MTNNSCNNSSTSNLITESTTSRTLLFTDASALISTTNGSTTTVTVPLNSSVPYTIGTQIDFVQTGAGQLVFAATGGVTINSKLNNLKVVAQYSGATLKKIAADTWWLVGDLSA